MIFISWSGKDSKSHQTAILLRDWIPKVIQRRRCFLSSHDIEAGAQWLPKLFAELEKSHVGILCLTPTNLNKPWLLFEAGALAKGLDVTRVCPFLIGFKSTNDVPFPLAAFQIKTGTREDMRALLDTVNRAPGMDPLSAGELDEAFNARWGEFDREWKRINELKEVGEPAAPQKGERELLEEMHSWLRGIAVGSLKVSLRSEPQPRAWDQPVGSFLFNSENPWSAAWSAALGKITQQVAEEWYSALIDKMGAETPAGLTLKRFKPFPKAIEPRAEVTNLKVIVPPETKYLATLLPFIVEINEKLTEVANKAGTPGPARLVAGALEFG